MEKLPTHASQPQKDNSFRSLSSRAFHLAIPSSFKKSHSQTELNKNYTQTKKNQKPNEKPEKSSKMEVFRSLRKSSSTNKSENDVAKDVNVPMVKSTSPITFELPNNQKLSDLIVIFRNLILFDGVPTSIVEEIHATWPEILDFPKNSENNQNQANVKVKKSNSNSSFNGLSSPKLNIKAIQNFIGTSTSNWNLCVSKETVKSQNSCPPERGGGKTAIASTKNFDSLVKKYNIRLDDHFLARFLHVSKYDTTKALERYKLYYKTILQIPKIESLLINDFSWFIESTNYISKNPCFKLYGYDAKKRRILGFDSTLFDVDVPHFVEYYLSAMISLCEWTADHFEGEGEGEDKGDEDDGNFEEEDVFNTPKLQLSDLDNCQPASPTNKLKTDTSPKNTSTNSTIPSPLSCVFIGRYHDFDTKKFKILAKPEFFKLICKLIDKCLPILIKNIYLYDEPYLVNVLFKMLKPFLSDKICDRVNFVGKDLSLVVEDLGGWEYVPNFIPGGLREEERLPISEKAVEYTRRALPVLLR